MWPSNTTSSGSQPQKLWPSLMSEEKLDCIGLIERDMSSSHDSLQGIFKA